MLHEVAPEPARDGERAGPLRGHATTLVVDEAIRFIDRAGDRPFAVFVTFHAPHEQVETPEAYTAMYADVPDPTRRAYYGSVSLVDHEVGRLMAALDERRAGWGRIGRCRVGEAEARDERSGPGQLQFRGRVDLVDYDSVAGIDMLELGLERGNDLQERLCLSTSTSGSCAAPVVPVPAAVWLFGSALGLLGVARRKLAA